MVDRALVFGEAADVYDRVRPGYPASLVRDVCSYAAREHLQLLEVGAGTGKATAAFADHVDTLLALEPDPAMAAVLIRRVAGHPHVRVVTSSLEDHAPSDRWDILLSAEAWHWVDPARRWQLALDHLTTGGVIALCWHYDRPARSEQRAAVADALQPTPELGGHQGAPPAESLADTWPATEMAAQPALTNLRQHGYHWSRTVSVADFVGQLSTQSSFRTLSEARRTQLLDRVAAGLSSVASDVSLEVETRLYLARVDFPRPDRIEDADPDAAVGPSTLTGVR